MPHPEDRRPLLAFCAFCGASLALAGFGTLATGRVVHFYLVWNLVLAVVPLALAVGVDALVRNRREIPALALGVPWLLFLPNAPYILTDFIHLQHPFHPWTWGHLLLLVWFSFAGLASGVLSLHIVHRCVAERLGPMVGWMFVGGVSLLTGLGVALGRFQRWNSWDILHQPTSIAHDLLRHFPLARPTPEAVLPWGLGAFYGFAYLLFWSLRSAPARQSTTV
ncbi:MAG: DUF1361 domain-containing protein [Limisphaerales bacterium]